MSKITGGKQLAANLKSLASVLGRPLNEASRKALRPTLAAAKKNIKANDSIESGELLKLLTIKRDPASKKDAPVHMVGPDSKKSAHYRVAHLIELGTAPHDVDGKPHPGANAAPFLRPALEETQDEVLRLLGEEFGTALEKAATRLGANFKK